MKRLLVITLLITTLFTSIISANEIKYNDEVLKPGVNELVSFDDVVYVNPGYVLKKIGYEVWWNIQYNNLVLYSNKNALHIDMYTGKVMTAKYGAVSEEFEFENRPLVVNNKPMVPLLETLEALEYGVIYNNDVMVIVDKFDYIQLKEYKQTVIDYINDTYGEDVKSIHEDGDFGVTGTIYFDMEKRPYCYATIDTGTNLVEDSIILRDLEKKYKEKYRLKSYYGYSRENDNVVSYKNLYITGAGTYKANIEVWCAGDLDEYLAKNEKELYNLAKGLYRDGIEVEIVCSSIDDYPETYEIYYDIVDAESIKTYKLTYENDMTIEEFYAGAELFVQK